MRNTIGIPARAENYLRRDTETMELWHKATRGHVLMLAPRRVGKTSILYHLRDRPLDGWRCLFFSVEALKDESQFVARLLAAICEAHPDGAWRSRFRVSLRDLLKTIGAAKVGPVQVKLASAIGDDWQDVGATALSVMQEIHGKTLVLVDEFPIFVRRLLADSERGKERAHLFLDWFREIRNAEVDKTAEVYFLLTGSLGLDAVVRAVNMTATINDLAAFRLGPLSDELAESLLRQLGDGEGLPLNSTIRQRIRRHVDWPIPFHLQLLFAELLSLVKFHGNHLDEGLVDEAYSNLLEPVNRKYFNHWVERLDEPLLTPEERDLKKELLVAAARDRRGMIQNTIIQIREHVAPGMNEQGILANLEHDGYLTRHNDRWRFTSSLLRDWWLKWQTKK